MSIADKILGMSRKEVTNYDFPSVDSSYKLSGYCRNFRVNIGRYLFPDQLNERRELLKNNIADALK